MPEHPPHSSPSTVVLPWSVRVATILCSGLLLSCGEKNDPPQVRKESKNSDPAKEAVEEHVFEGFFDRMEPGSVVKDLLVPRYDENKRPTSVLRALRVIIESQTLVRAEKLSVHLLASGHQQKLVNSLYEIDGCLYHLDTGMIRSDSQVLALSDNFHFSSQGLITKMNRTDWEKGDFSIYFLPPFSGFINPEPTSSAIAMKPYAALTAALVSSLAAQTTDLRPAVPAAPQPAFFAMEPRTEQAEKNLQEFAKENQIKITAIVLPPLPLDAQKAVEPVEPIPAYKPSLDALGFACKGGVFLDGKTSVLTLMKEITVRDPSYALTVAGEVKVIFEPKKEPTKIKDPKDKKQAVNGLGKLMRIDGNGGVAFEAADAKGVKNFASGDSVSYEESSKEVTLRGRRLVFQQGTQSRFESANPQAWLKFNKETKDFQMSDGWTARIALPPK